MLTFRNVSYGSQGSNWNNFFCVVIEYVVVDFFLNKDIGVMSLDRSKHSEVFCKKRVLRNFAKFTRKHLLLKKRLFSFYTMILFKATLAQVFSCFAKFLRTPFFIQHVWWLLLSKIYFALLPFTHFNFAWYWEYPIKQIFHAILRLTLSWRWPLSYRNQSIDLESKSMDWFLYDRDLHNETVHIE